MTGTESSRGSHRARVPTSRLGEAVATGVAAAANSSKDAAPALAAAVAAQTVLDMIKDQSTPATEDQAAEGAEPVDPETPGEEIRPHV